MSQWDGSFEQKFVNTYYSIWILLSLVIAKLEVLISIFHDFADLEKCKRSL